MMRAVIGAIMSAVMGLFLLWFILPMLTTAYESVKQSLPNPTDPNIVQLWALGDGVYSMLGLIVIVVVGYLIFAYATQREPFDV